jgi:DNA polymerase elongation subunit (family B)
MNKAKVLLLDIETMPMMSYIWQLHEEQMGTSMLKTDWCILSWSAKWLDKSEIMYSDQRNAKNIEDEKKILEKLWHLMDEADVVIGHNSKRFDVKRINARFIKHGMQPPSPFRQVDTLSVAKKHFAFTSNKLEYLAKFLGCKLKKLTKRKYPGFELWKECLANNKDAWKEMQQYNKQDVLVLEEVYRKLAPWDNTINFAVFNNGEHVCSCGSKELISKGHAINNSGIFKRYKCKSCGKSFQEKTNELSPEARKNMKKGISR